MTPPTTTTERLTPAEHELERLCDLQADDQQAPPEIQRAAALLRQLPKPTPLSGSAYLRIEETLLQRGPAAFRGGLPWLRRLAWGGGAMATVAASFVFGWGLHSRSQPGTSAPPALAVRAADLRQVRLPGESQARLLTQRGDVLDFAGPGELSLAGEEITLTEGKLGIESSANPVWVRVGVQRVRVAAFGSGQVRALHGELVYVAAYRGALTVERPSQDQVFQSFEVPAGATWPTPQATASSAAAATPVTAPVLAVSPPPRPAHRPLRVASPRPTASTPLLGASPPVAAPAPSQSGDASLLAESQLLGQALQRLHREHDPAGALSVLDSYSHQYGEGRLRDEAQATRVDALMQLNRQPDALRILDAAPLVRLARGGELRLLRGELRAHAGRCREAISDFSASWQAEASRDGEAGQRALYGLATCRLALGERGLAREALQKYLERYPAGRFSDAARDALSQLK